MSKIVWAAAALCGLTLMLTGCGAREVRITTTEMKFEPAVIEAKAGETVNFVIVNKGAELHEFVNDNLLWREVEVEAGETKSVKVTMPKEPGEYEFYCEAKGHREAGMVGKLVVNK